MRAALTIPLFLACAAGCGGKERERPPADYQTGGGAPATGCEADDGLEFETISDFESGTAQLWWTSHDDSPNAWMKPDPNKGQSPPSDELADPRCDESAYAFRIQASNLLVYGGSFGISFLTQYPLGRDASDWEGLSFWVKRNGEARGRSFFASLNDRNTDSSARTSIQAKEDAQGIDTEEIVPDCNDDSLIESEKCDRFGAGVPLAEEWTFVAIPFDKMRQRGFGVVSPGLDVEALAGINCGFEIGDWDFYIDDVAFYRAADSSDSE